MFRLLGEEAKEIDPSDKPSSRGYSRYVKPAKKRVRVTNISLSTSDYDIEDAMKAIGNLIYSQIYDHKESRVGVFEYETQALNEEAVEKINGQIIGENTVEAEIFEQKPRGNDRGRGRGRGRGGYRGSSLSERMG